MAVGFSWDESKPMIHDTNILRYLEQPPSTNRNSRLPTAASTAQDYHRGVRPWHILSCSSSKMGASQNAIPLQKLHFYWENEDKPATIKRHHIICRTYGRNMEKSNWFYLNPPTKIEHLSTYACWSWHETVWFLAAPPIDSNHTKKWYWQKLRCGWRLHTCSGFKNHIRRHIRRLCKFLQNLLLPFHLGKFQRPLKLP